MGHQAFLPSMSLQELKATNIGWWHTMCQVFHQTQMIHWQTVPTHLYRQIAGILLCMGLVGTISPAWEYVKTCLIFPVNHPKSICPLRRKFFFFLKINPCPTSSCPTTSQKSLGLAEDKGTISSASKCQMERELESGQHYSGFPWKTGPGETDESTAWCSYYPGPPWSQCSQTYSFCSFYWYIQSLS